MYEIEFFMDDGFIQKHSLSINQAIAYEHRGT
jgi:hypothetical protein